MTMLNFVEHTHTTIHVLDLQPHVINMISALFLFFYESGGRKGTISTLIAHLATIHKLNFWEATVSILYEL